MSKKRPFVLGLGGTTRDGSSTERVLRVSLAAAERLIGLFRRLDGIVSAIGRICCAAAWQAGGPTLIAMRNTSLPLFGESGQLVDESTRMQLALVGRQVAEFAQLRLNSSALSEAG